MTEKAGKLQINEDLAFQRREWQAQHIGWIALCAFVATALAGVFGGGPLSHARAGEPGSALWVEYQRFVRRGAADRMTIHLGPAAEPRRELELRMSREYFDDMRIEHIHPEPGATEVGTSEVVFRFSGESGERTTSVVFDLEPLSAGRRRLTLAASGAAPLTLSQFVYF